jgi:hypothetical protein
VENVRILLHALKYSMLNMEQVPSLTIVLAKMLIVISTFVRVVLIAFIQMVKLLVSVVGS